MPSNNPSHHRLLAAERLACDPRVEAAKELLRAAVADAQGPLKLCGADPERQEEYKTLLHNIATARGASLWYPYLGSGMGKGPLVELLDGSVKYDLINGIGTHYLGHSHPALLDAAIDAALGNTVMQGHLQQNNDASTLMQLLTSQSGLDHCFLTTSGAMANENALKIAFQKTFPASRILAFTNGFAGRSLALAQISDKAQYRQGLPATLAVDYIPFYEAQQPEESCHRAQECLRQYLERYPGQHAALWCELILGEGGCYAGSSDFFAPLMQMARQAGSAIIVDEVQTFGRTPRLFAFQHFGLESYVDIVTAGKLLQVCTTLFRHEWAPRPGLLSQTFTNSTVAIRSATAVLHTLLEGGYLGEAGKIATLQTAFVDGLKDIARRHPTLMHGPYGCGAMAACTVYDGTAPATYTFLHALFKAGIIAFYAGAHPTRVRFLLPIGALSLGDINTIIPLLEEVLVAHQPQVSL